jgi:hypothetical protein
VIPKVVGGDFHFVQELRGDQVELVRERRLLELREECADSLAELDNDAGVERLGCWWFRQDSCQGSALCECGPVTLLEVLDCIDEGERQKALEMHLAHLGTLYDHYWTCERILQHPGDIVETSCGECVIGAGTHIHTLRTAAQDLAIELGEALSCYNNLVLLGTSRYDHHGGTLC